MSSKRLRTYTHTYQLPAGPASTKGATRVCDVSWVKLVHRDGAECTTRDVAVTHCVQVRGSQWRVCVQAGMSAVSVLPVRGVTSTETETQSANMTQRRSILSDNKHLLCYRRDCTPTQPCSLLCQVPISKVWQTQDIHISTNINQPLQSSSTLQARKPQRSHAYCLMISESRDISGSQSTSPRHETLSKPSASF